MMELGQKRSDRLSNQLLIVRSHEFRGRAVGQLDKTSLIDRHNCRWTPLDQYPYPFLGLQV
jgi:hypothetical protein